MPASTNRRVYIYAPIKPSGCIAFPDLAGKVIQPPGVYRARISYMPASMNRWKCIFI